MVWPSLWPKFGSRPTCKCLKFDLTCLMNLKIAIIEIPVGSWWATVGLYFPPSNLRSRSTYSVNARIHDHQPTEQLHRPCCISVNKAIKCIFGNKTIAFLICHFVRIRNCNAASQRYQRALPALLNVKHLAFETNIKPLPFKCDIPC